MLVLRITNYELLRSLFLLFGSVNLKQCACFIDFLFYGPVNTFRSCRASVTLSTQALGRLPKWLTCTKSPWISGMEGMATEITSWPNVYELYVAGSEDRTQYLLNTSWTAHPTDLVGPAEFMCIAIIGPGHAKTCLMPYANNKGADQPGHPHSLISTFVFHCLDGMICIFAISKVSRF